MALLEIRGLQTYFKTPQGTARAVDGVDLTVREGEVLGVVGESGCGKSVMALSVLRLLPRPPAFFAGGQIRFRGTDLLRLSDEEIRRIRGNRISMIFQEPMTALNPVFTVGNQLSEVFRTHQRLSRAEARQRAVEMLGLVGIPSPQRRYRSYPHEMSGGMRQRVMIAMALACRPDLLLADEPTTALDVTIQAQILDLMKELREQLGTAIVLITHDMGVVAEMADRVAVMYLGRVVEEAETRELFERPLHPYTRGLLRAIPSVSQEKSELFEIPGTVPSPVNLPDGCPFHPRCPDRQEGCRRERPVLEELHAGHRVACWVAQGGSA
ncbi:ABC transporter ATP-binding protein [Deferrisoma camini]|uniref:ABC transporter ATP-binding protein n=1 Tax=Deferrisoma camini TaxID=1035120 RepID=UPI00046D74CD|nr:ABC transporter ATP-binding protein [Deferrisoma camini]